MTSSDSSPPSNRVGPYIGVWQRTALEEPRGVHCDWRGIVLWLQTPCGRFVDIRIPDPRAPETCKSFAGLGALTSDASGAPLFTWTRRIDYRGPGIADIAYVNMIGPDEIEELSFLPGDDYREVWTRLTSAQTPAREIIACDLHWAGQESRLGFFVRVGEYWGLALGRPETERGVELLREFFGASSQEDVAGAAEVAAAYVCAVGRVVQQSGSSKEARALLVEHCTDASMEGGFLVLESSRASSVDTTSASCDALRERFSLGRWVVNMVEGEDTDVTTRRILALLRGEQMSA